MVKELFQEAWIKPSAFGVVIPVNSLECCRCTVQRWSHWRRGRFQIHLETRRRIASMKGHTDLVLTVAFSPDGSRIAPGSRDKTVRIWDVQTGRQTQGYHGHEDKVVSVLFL